MTDLEALKAQISDEADLCRNEGATDIASLLDDTRYTIETQAREIERLQGLVSSYRLQIDQLHDRAALAGDSHD